MRIGLMGTVKVDVKGYTDSASVARHGESRAKRRVHCAEAGSVSGHHRTGEDFRFYLQLVGNEWNGFTRGMIWANGNFQNPSGNCEESGRGGSPWIQVRKPSSTQEGDGGGSTQVRVMKVEQKWRPVF